MDDLQPPRSVTNQEFADKVQCHFTMSSRLRNGERIPSSGLLARIVEAYDIKGPDLDSMFVALNGDDPPQEFGEWLTRVIFDRPLTDAA